MMVMGMGMISGWHEWEWELMMVMGMVDGHGSNGFE